MKTSFPRRILRMAGTEDKVGLKESQNPREGRLGRVSQPVRLSAPAARSDSSNTRSTNISTTASPSASAATFPAHLSGQDRGLARGPSRKAREARCGSEQQQHRRKPRGRKHVETQHEMQNAPAARPRRPRRILKNSTGSGKSRTPG